MHDIFHNFIRVMMMVVHVNKSVMENPMAKTTREKVRERKLKAKRARRRNCHSLTVIYSLSFIFKTKGKKVYCLSYFLPFSFLETARKIKKGRRESHTSVERRFEPKWQQNVHKCKILINYLEIYSLKR